MVFSKFVFWFATAASVAGLLYTCYSFWVFHNDMDLPEDISEKEVEPKGQNIYEKTHRTTKNVIFKIRDGGYANSLMVVPHYIAADVYRGSKGFFSIPTGRDQHTFHVGAEHVSNKALWEVEKDGEDEILDFGNEMITTGVDQ